MKKISFRFAHNFFLLGIVILAFLSSCSNNTADNEKTNTVAASTNNSTNAETETLLRRFDSLDYDIYSHQKWDSFQISHADDILVHYPDGSTSKGLADHLTQLKPMFVFAPDTRIQEHPVKFGTNGWTSVIGTMEGTFSAPMPVGNGKTIAPTGKKFKLAMSTVANWKDGKMIEEYLFWDNQAFMKQIGLAQ